MERLIRRYENRKLYDTVGSTYVSLRDIAGLIREGHEIRVVEAASGEDITTRTLASIVIEVEPSGQEWFSSGFLHDLIRWGGEVVTLTVDQVEQQLDRLVRASFERLGPVREAREATLKLQERIEILESALARLVESDSDGSETSSPESGEQERRCNHD